MARMPKMRVLVRGEWVDLPVITVEFNVERVDVDDATLTLLGISEADTLSGMHDPQFLITRFQNLRDSTNAMLERLNNPPMRADGSQTIAAAVRETPEPMAAMRDSVNRLRDYAGPTIVAPLADAADRLEQFVVRTVAQRDHARDRADAFERSFEGQRAELDQLRRDLRSLATIASNDLADAEGLARDHIAHTAYIEALEGMVHAGAKQYGRSAKSVDRALARARSKARSAS